MCVGGKKGRKSTETRNAVQSYVLYGQHEFYPLGTAQEVTRG